MIRNDSQGLRHQEIAGSNSMSPAPHITNVMFRVACDFRLIALPRLMKGARFRRASKLRRGHTGSRLMHAVGLQDVSQADHAENSMNIGAADHGKQIDLVCAHALERQIQTLIRMHVGEQCFPDYVA